MGPPKPRSKRAAMVMDDDNDYSPMGPKKTKPGFKGEPMFLDGESDDEGMNGTNPMKKVKISKQNGFEESTSFGPHVIKVMDEDMLDRVCQKYKKMGHSVQLKNNIIKLNQIKSDTCLQEEVMTNFNAMILEHCDVTLVSTNNQEVPCHRFILAARSPVFKRLFTSQAATGEPCRESIDSSTEALKAMVKYLYTDTLENTDINEDLMNLADKYELTQMKELCLPFFVKKVRGDNCLKAYIYGHLHNYEPLKAAAFQAMDENWSRYESSTDITEMMKTHPNAVLEILNRLYKRKSGSLFAKQGTNLKMIKAFQCLQEEIIKAYGEKLEFTDLMLVSSTGQEIPCHRYVLAVRSPDFKSMFAMQAPPVGEPLKIHLDATTGAVGALVKYLYTDAVDNDDITEDLIALASKYNLVQLKEYCLPTFIENLNASNCLNMYVYAFKLNFDELKTAAFKTLDENWKMHQNSSEFLEMMKSCPNAVLEIMNRFQKITDCQPIVLENVKPRLVDF
jgi:uncharacterized protein (UPF0248 family)